MSGLASQTHNMARKPAFVPIDAEDESFFLSPFDRTVSRRTTSQNPPQTYFRAPSPQHKMRFRVCVRSVNESESQREHSNAVLYL